MTLNPKDIVVECTRRDLGGQHVGYINHPVKVTHTPTGLTATACGQSQYMSRTIALEMIEYAILTYGDKLA